MARARRAARRRIVLYKRLLAALSLLVLAVPSAQAIRDTLIEVELPRHKDGGPVLQRAILSQADTGALTTALLFFRGGHGMAKISSLLDPTSQAKWCSSSRQSGATAPRTW